MAFGSKGYDPVELPRMENSELDTLRYVGMVTIPPHLEDEFAKRFNEIVRLLAGRDFSRVKSDQFLCEIMKRGYTVKSRHICYDGQIDMLWQEVKNKAGTEVTAFELYCDVFVAALIACPKRA